MRSAFRSLAFLVIGLCVCVVSASAEMVKDVGPDGTLILEGGKQVVLAGVVLDGEGVSVLRVLAMKQDLKLQLITQTAPGAKESAYAYLQAKYVKFPVKPGGFSDNEEIMLNEFLVKIGAAKVLAGKEFRQKAKFLKAQEEAKKKGEGVWSYAVS